jgi:hypothetical protein
MPGIFGYYNLNTEVISPYAVVTNPKATQTVNQPLTVALNFFDTVAGKDTFTVANGGFVTGTLGFSVLSGFLINSATNNLEIAGYSVAISGPSPGDVLEFDGTHWVNSSTASAGVTSLNGLSGALTLVAGAGISITPSGHNITIAATGGSAAQLVKEVVQLTVTIPAGGTVFSYTPPSVAGMYRVSWVYDVYLVSTISHPTFDLTYEDSLGNAALISFLGAQYGGIGPGSDIVYSGFVDFQTDGSGADVVFSVEANVGESYTGSMSATLERLL